ncbi:MAG: chromosome segregation protein SMC [Ruminococcaceae bacterium]|nr:chromosome segregation protein SMC [Oscillospiraceae bacterium]
MYLKGITMQGFKSFADKIELEFGQGITSIVGPNGSGKSNVSDAIRWVMGEQSAKSLRGGSMQDVIFAGTAKRKPLGFAQVTITLDNSDKVFSVDSKSVTVMRRVHRSGEGEYFINGKPCRLKDVHELFMDTGLGREGYSVIGQGKIDEILSSKSEDRRHIFEEAAGITKYKYRKHEAEKKLDQTEENLVRIKDLLVALEEQVGPLEQQAAKARKYLDLRETLKVLDVNIALHNVDKHKENLEKCAKAYQIALDQLNAEKEGLKLLETQIEADDAALAQALGEVNQARQSLFELEKSSGSLSGKVDILENNLENNRKNIARIGEEIAGASERINMINAEEELQEKKLGEIAAIQAQEREKEEELKKRAAELDAEIARINAGAEQGKSKIVDLLGEVSGLRAKSNSLDVLEKSFDERKSTVAEDIATKKRQHAEVLKDIEVFEETEKKIAKEREGFEKILGELKTEYFKITADLDKAKAEQNERTSKFNELQSRKNVLSELEKGYEGYYRSVKEIVKQQMPGVHGVVSKLLEVDGKYVTAVEIALGSALQNIVVEDEQAAKRGIAYLKQHNAGRATFLPLTAVRGSKLDRVPSGEKGYVGLACDLIGYDKKYDGIFRSLLGRVVVVEDIDCAVAIAKKNKYQFKIVTLSGDVVNAGGSMTGGSVSQNQRLLSRVKDIEQLKNDIAELEKEINACDRVIGKAKSRIGEIAKKKEECDAGVQRCENEGVRLTALLQGKRHEAEELAAGTVALTDESGAIVKELAGLNEQREQIAEQILAQEKEICAEREKVEEFTRLFTQRNTEREKLGQQMTEGVVTAAKLAKDIEAAKALIETLKGNRNAQQEDVLARQEECAAIEEENKAILAEMEQIRSNIENTKGETAVLAKDIEEKQLAYEQGVGKLKEKQKLSKEKNEGIYVLSQETARLESRKEKIEFEMENVMSKLWDEYELTYTASLDYRKAELVIGDATREAASLRGQIKALGNINIDAIDEYKVVKEKYEFLSSQKQDLDESKSKLEKLICEMQDIMTDQFKESFEAIRIKFNNVFRELFGGGSGKLYLNDPANVLESGIEIEVQPPGKRLQNLMALSGGERAFAAIALLFAVLEVRPTPFCILDEVEAALDDVNVYRFADYVKKYSGKTQFIVVTHRRGTMEAADIMYGVTMQEKGVSKLLKLKFEDLEEYDVQGI